MLGWIRISCLLLLGRKSSIPMKHLISGNKSRLQGQKPSICNSSFCSHWIIYNQICIGMISGCLWNVPACISHNFVILPLLFLQEGMAPEVPLSLGMFMFIHQLKCIQVPRYFSHYILTCAWFINDPPSIHHIFVRMKRVEGWHHVGISSSRVFVITFEEDVIDTRCNSKTVKKRLYNSICLSKDILVLAIEVVI